MIEFIDQLRLVLLLAETGYESLDHNEVDEDTLLLYSQALNEFEQYVKKCEAGSKK